MKRLIGILTLIAAISPGCDRGAPPQTEPQETQVTVDPKIAKAGVIVCSHVAAEGAPILRAERSEPVDPVDSGWQVLCDSGKEEQIKHAQVWSVSEVAELEPSLAQFMDSAIGTVLARKDASSEWSVAE